MGHDRGLCDDRRDPKKLKENGSMNVGSLWLLHQTCPCSELMPGGHGLCSLPFKLSMRVSHLEPSSRSRNSEKVRWGDTRCDASTNGD